MRIAAGIVMILAGLFGGILMLPLAVLYIPNVLYSHPDPLFLFIGYALAFLAIAGGVSAFKRKYWKLCLAGAISSAVIVPLFLGILAIIFLVLGRKDFKLSAVTVPTEAAQHPLDDETQEVRTAGVKETEPDSGGSIKEQRPTIGSMKAFGWLLFSLSIFGLIHQTIGYTQNIFEFLVNLPLFGGLAYLGWWLAHKK